MTRLVRLADEVDVAGWRDAARALARAGVAPADIVWRVGEGGDLFADAPAPAPARAPAGASLRASRRFLELVDVALRHRDPSRFDLCYRLLVRLQSTPALLEIETDAEVRAARALAQAVRRDRHKMTAFLRFREVAEEEGARYVAWFEPDHFVEEHVAPFFVDRYAAMRFTILTPRRVIDWTDRRLTFGPGARRADAPPEDDFAAAWALYYRSIFNPARLMPRAMRKEMPKKYWANLPETRHIPEMTAQAAARLAAHMAQPVATDAPRWRARRLRAGDASPTPPADDFLSLRREAANCRRCPLGACATQTVFGEGPREAAILFVGEQPGDREDLVGRPFVGPAGEVFDAALAQAGLDRARCYVTNAVKHFKFEPRGKRRIHQTPVASEIEACRWWLDRELKLVAAPLVVALGATALRALAGPSAKLSERRGRVVAFGEGRRLFATVHPSFVLRLPDAQARARETAAFHADIRAAAALAA